MSLRFRQGGQKRNILELGKERRRSQQRQPSSEPCKECTVIAAATPSSTLPTPNPLHLIRSHPQDPTSLILSPRPRLLLLILRIPNPKPLPRRLPIRPLSLLVPPLFIVDEERISLVLVLQEDFIVDRGFLEVLFEVAAEEDGDEDCDDDAA